MTIKPIKSIPVGSREGSSVRLVAYRSGTIRKTSMGATNWTIIWLICGLVSQIGVRMARSGQWGSVKYHSLVRSLAIAKIEPIGYRLSDLMNSHRSRMDGCGPAGSVDSTKFS
jgi:hypothetical protein